MLKMLLIRFWPVWIPLILYLLWWYVKLLRAKKQDETAPRIQDGPWLWTVVITLVLAIVMFFWLGLSQHSESSTQYKPAQIKDGKIVTP